MATVDAPTLPFEAESPSDRRATRVRISRALTLAHEWLVPVLIAALTIGVLASVAILRDRERGYRNAEVALGNIGGQFAKISASPLALVDGLQSPAQVETAMRMLERTVNSELRIVGQNLPATTYDAVAQPLLAGFANAEQARALLGRDPHLTSPGSLRVGLALASVGEANGATASAAIKTAEEDADSAAWVAQVESTVSSVLTILGLLSLFFFFYRRSLRAVGAAQALASALGRSERHLAHAQQLAGVGSWEWHAASGRLVWSEQQSRLHHWPHAQPPSIPQEGLALIDAPYRVRLATAIEALWRDGTPLSVDYAITRDSGTLLVHCQGDRAYENGVPVGLIGTCQDVTERFKRVEAERANTAKSQFLSRTSHELRTPLNAILGFAQLLALGDLDERQHSNVDHVVKAGRHLLGLVDDVLEISRIESGETGVALEPVTIAAAISDAIGITRPLADSHDVAISLAPGEERTRALADPQRLTQVLLNLISNAIKYNDAGGHVEVAVARTPSGQVTIAVADDGRGIALDLQARLFTPFDRLGAEDGPVAGTGLGLALSKAFVEAMGGRLAVDSAAGRGSTFTITLAHAEPDRRHRPPPAPRRANTAAPQRISTG